MVDEVAVALATIEPPPERLGVTHWSTRLLGAELGISHVWVGKIWKRWGLQPWRSDSRSGQRQPLGHDCVWRELTRNPQLSRTGDSTPVVNLSLADNTRRLLDRE